MKDSIQVATAFNNTLRIYACCSTNLVEKARQIHGLWPTVTAAFGRSLTVASMMSCFYKGQEYISIKIDGDGPIGNMTIEAHNGIVRGYVKNPEVFLQYNDGHLAVGKAVGNGFINVTKFLGLKEPFTSTCQIVSGEIAEDFTYYFASSEQTPSSVGLGVLVDVDNSCIAAGGFIIQLMPGCSEETITYLENKLQNIKPASQMISEGYTPVMIIEELVDKNYQILDEVFPQYLCDCSKENFYNSIKKIGINEIETIKNEDHGASIVCAYCKKEYNFSETDLDNMINEIENGTF